MKKISKSIKIVKIFSVIFFIILTLLGIWIFKYYLINIQELFLCKWGYTICTYRGQDFFQLYQSAYNLLNSYYIYGISAEKHLVTPIFTTMRYFPVSPLIWGSFFILTKSIEIAYGSYLLLSIVLHLLSIILIYLIAKKTKASFLVFSVVIFMWLTYFSLNSEWNIGQFNHLAGMFFLGMITAVIYYKKMFGAILWILSLAWKPIAILAFPYFLKTKNKTAIGLFILLFVVFSGGYILYYQFLDHNAFKTFIVTTLDLGVAFDKQIHYHDNFSVFSLITEIFYDNNQLLWKANYWIYSLLIVVFYFFISFKIKFKSNKIEIYYLIFATITFLILHRQIWESWLTFWLPILSVLLLFSKSTKETIFLIICAFMLGTPTLFYFWNQDQTTTWRFWLIAEKVLPQSLVYIYVLLKMLRVIRIQLKTPLSNCQINTK